MFSMESIFILKQHLLQQYKKYFIIEYKCDNYLAKFEQDFKMTIINEEMLFPESKFNKIKDISDNTSKDFATPISSCFRRHAEKNMKNNNIDSPELICKREGPQEIHDHNLTNVGESGLFIESFIGNQDEMYDIDFSRHLGEILDYKYYIQENFFPPKEKTKELEPFKLDKPSVKEIVFKKLNKKTLKKKGVENKYNNKNDKDENRIFKYNKRQYSHCYCGDPYQLECYLRFINEGYPKDL